MVQEVGDVFAHGLFGDFARVWFFGRDFLRGHVLLELARKEVHDCDLISGDAENYFGGSLSSLEERENEKFTEGNRSDNTCQDSLTEWKSSDRPEFGWIQCLIWVGGDLRSMKTKIERIKETVRELGWCCTCLLAVLILENFEI